MNATTLLQSSTNVDDKAVLREMLIRMLRIRMFDERVALLRTTSIPGAVHNCTGQEAEIVGACMALRGDDYMTGNHRSHGHPIGKGVGLAPLMAELFGKSTGVCKGKGGSMHLAAFGVGSLGESGIVGSLMPVAVGAGLSARIRRSDQVCLCFFGDGAANCGPFHESLNLAAIWKLPIIFLCENNGYAMCTAQAQTTSVANIADRATSYQIPGVVVDGQDILAVYQTVAVAIARARAGLGPTLVEAKTYRYCDHQEIDFPWPVYRAEDEIRSWQAKDPITLFIGQITDRGVLTTAEITDLKSHVGAELEAAVTFAEQSPLPEPAAVVEDLFV